MSVQSGDNMVDKTGGKRKTRPERQGGGITAQHKAGDKRQTRLEAATASWTGGHETNWETRLERREKQTRSQSKE